jgi:hypothetical protein
VCCLLLWLQQQLLLQLQQPLLLPQALAAARSCIPQHPLQRPLPLLLL